MIKSSYFWILIETAFYILMKKIDILTLQSNKERISASTTVLFWNNMSNT